MKGTDIQVGEEYAAFRNHQGTVTYVIPTRVKVLAGPVERVVTFHGHIKGWDVEVVQAGEDAWGGRAGDTWFIPSRNFRSGWAAFDAADKAKKAAKAEHARKVVAAWDEHDAKLQHLADLLALHHWPSRLVVTHRYAAPSDSISVPLDWLIKQVEAARNNAYEEC